MSVKYYLVTSYVLSGGKKNQPTTTRNEHELEFTAICREDLFIFRTSQCITHHSAQAEALKPLARMANGKMNLEAAGAGTSSKGRT